MADQNDPTNAAPAAADGQPQAGTPAPEATPDAQAAAGDNATISLEDARKLRSESQNLRKRLKELEDEKQKAADAQLSEVERAKKQADAAQTRLAEIEGTLRQERVGREVERTAAKLKLDPELAGRLVAPDMLEYDDDGKPTNTEKVLKGLIAKWPNLVKADAPPPDINANQGRGSGQQAVDPQAEEARIRKTFRI